MIYNDATTDALGRIVLAGSYGTTRQGAVQRLSTTCVPDTTFNGTSSLALFTARTNAPAIEAYSTTFKRVFLDGG